MSSKRRKSAPPNKLSCSPIQSDTISMDNDNQQEQEQENIDHELNNFICMDSNDNVEDMEYLNPEEEEEDDDDEKATATTTTTTISLKSEMNKIDIPTPSSTTATSSSFVNRCKVFEELIENCKLNCIKESLIQSNEISSNGQMDKNTILMAEKRLNQIIDQLSRLRQRFIRNESSNIIEDEVCIIPEKNYKCLHV